MLRVKYRDLWSHINPSISSNYSYPSGAHSFNGAEYSLLCILGSIISDRINSSSFPSLIINSFVQSCSHIQPSFVLLQSLQTLHFDVKKSDNFGWCRLHTKKSKIPPTHHSLEVVVKTTDFFWVNLFSKNPLNGKIIDQFQN